jgi:2'-hydroxyisoflavone reductase
MTSSRRDFIKAGALGAAAAAAGLPGASEAAAKKAAQEPLDILVLGGTGFIGPHMVREALRRGHSVTLFNRGRTNDKLFPDIELIKGDRDGGLDGLRGRRWDAVIDNSGYVPRHVGDSASLLAPNVGHYLFVSTASVYADFTGPNSEDSPLAKLVDQTVEEITGETYGGLKALCEQRAADAVGDDRCTILRPTYICGPGDRSDRFTWWPVRSRSGGDMIWPGTPADRIQIIDVVDLAIFTIDCLERRVAGTFNMATEDGICTMGSLYEDCRAITAADVNPVWISEEFAYQQELIGGRALPIWHPAGGPMAGNGAIVATRAREAGLRNRPVRETARDVLSWWDTLPGERTATMKAGLDAAREAEVIAAWKARSQGRG